MEVRIGKYLKPVQVIIDHKSLEYFMSYKFLTRRQTRWSEFFSKFNIKNIYKLGSFNNKQMFSPNNQETLF